MLAKTTVTLQTINIFINPFLISAGAMKIAVIGPDVKKVCEILNIEEPDYYSKVREVAEYLAKTEHEIVITPNKKSSVEFFAEAYSEEDGKKIIGVIPKDDTEFGTLMLNKHICDETINCKTWRNAPETLLENSNIVLVLGFGPGTLVELCYTKWFKVDNVFVIKDLITQKLPEELNELGIEYIGIDELKDKIK